MRHGMWALDPAITFLNHGSFGARPTSVLEHQRALSSRFESNPVRFVEENLEPMRAVERSTLASFLGLDAGGLVFVDNATTGVNTALRATPLRHGDEMLVTDHEYNACSNAMHAVAAATGASVVVATVPFPLSAATDVIDAVLSRVTPRTRLLLIDHVTSPTALVMPVQEIVDQLDPDITVVVDGAHSPGMVEPHINGVSYITGNCHKWMSAPPGAAYLWARSDLRNTIDPLVISHGWNSTRNNARLFELFDWTGTSDVSAVLSISTAIDEIASMIEGGWPEVRRRNHQLALAGRDVILDAIGGEPDAPDTMVGAMVAIRLSDTPGPPPSEALGMTDPLTARLRNEFAIEVPVFAFPSTPNRVLRISAHLHNDLSDYQRLADVLASLSL